LLVLLGLGCGVATAQEDFPPLLFHRLDPEAQDIPLTVNYRLDGSSRAVSGRMLLSGSEEVYIRSAPPRAASRPAGSGRAWCGSSACGSVTTPSPSLPAAAW
ncbi:MAG: hypothetical protein ABIF77_09690, partial [bacterium]